MPSAAEENPDEPVFGASARERDRLDALHRYDILDTRPEVAFDRLTDLATGFFDVDVAFVAFLDADRQWFKSSVGLSQKESTLAGSFCTHTLEREDLLVIEDATKDERVVDSPFVTDAGFRFYAGVPIMTPDGHAIGTFSLMHRAPRTLSQKDRNYLQMLAEMATDELENRRDAQTHKQVARRFEAVFEDPNVLAGVLAPDGTLLDTNETSLQYIEVSREEVLGTPFWETPWWPDDMQEEVRTWIERAAAGEYVDYEADLTTPGGTPFSVEGTVRPVLDRDGTVSSLVVSARDVTARTQREQQLRHQRSLLEQAQRLAGAWEADLQKGTMTWSKTVYEIHELSPDTDIGIEDGVQFYAPEARPKIREAFERCIEKREPYDLELPLLTAKGNRRWVRTVGAPAETKNGTVVKVAGAFQDITERKRAEDELKEMKQFYEQVLEHIPIDLAVFTPEARVEYVNPQGVSESDTRDWVLGHTNEEYCTKRGFDPTVGRRRDAAIRTAAREHTITKLEETLRTEDGPRHFLRVQSPVTNLEGTVTHVVGFGIDITERKRREQDLLGREQKIEALYTATEHLLKAKTPKEVAVQIEEVIRETFDYPLNGVHFVHDEQLVPVQVSPSIVERWPEMPPRDLSGTGLGARAHRSGTTVVSEDLQALDTTIDYQDLKSGAAIPLGAHGVITIGSTEKEGIDSFDVNLMEILAADAAAVLDRIEREHELQKKERRYRAVFEDPNILVGLLDPEGRVLDINRTALEYIGAPLEAIVGEPFWKTPWFEGDEALQDSVQEWIQRANDGEYAEFEADLSRAIGAPLVISGVVRPVTDEEGTVTSLLISDRDITARKQNRRQLERYREYTDRLLNASDDLFFVCDENGCLKRWNERLATVTGYSEAELDGMTLLDFVQDDERERTKAAVHEVFERGRSQIETFLVTKDGSAIPYEFAANCVEHPDGDLRLVGIGRDVTERKERERSLVEAKREAEEANRLKSAMLANMSHEIRTPLTSITGFAEVIEEELDGQLKAFAGRIYQSGQRLMKTLDSVLQLSKLEAGVYELERELLSLGPLVEETTKLLRPSAEEKSITLTTDVQDTPIDGLWNEGALNRILENLLENAIKFTPEHGTVVVRAWNEDDDAVLEVEDDGVGIRAEALSEIFEAFKQESEGLTREYEGSGLGLPIVQRLVEALDGVLEVDTKKGEGSRFTVRLPREHPAPESTDHSQEESLQLNGSPTGLKHSRPFIFRRMYRIAADQEASFEDKTARLIDLGREYLNLPYGFLTRISDGTQEIVSAAGDHPALTLGATCPLSEAYCRKTIQEDALLAIQNAPRSGWTNDPAYVRFELGSYIGSKIQVGGELYGTFCFAAPEPRRTPFTTEEKTFVELLTRWASYELERHRHKERLQRQKDRLEEFAGVVSHDLRNPLNVAQGRLTLALERIESTAPSSSSPPLTAETTATAQSHLYAVARALDRMEAIIADMLSLTWSEQEFDADDMEFVRLADVSVRCWEQVRTAEATLHIDDDLSLHAHEGRLRQLLENLFRNAVEHGGGEVTVTVGVLPSGFYVEDDGPGIPEEKREKALERGYSSTEDGTGLGLPIAEAIAEAHGWTLSITAGHAGGARFEITGIGAPPE